MQRLPALTANNAFTGTNTFLALRLGSSVETAKTLTVNASGTLEVGARPINAAPTAVTRYSAGGTLQLTVADLNHYVVVAPTVAEVEVRLPAPANWATGDTAIILNGSTGTAVATVADASGAALQTIDAGSTAMFLYDGAAIVQLTSSASSSSSAVQQFVARTGSLSSTGQAVPLQLEAAAGSSGTQRLVPNTAGTVLTVASAGFYEVTLTVGVPASVAVGVTLSGRLSASGAGNAARTLPVAQASAAASASVTTGLTLASGETLSLLLTSSDSNAVTVGTGDTYLLQVLVRYLGTGSA